MNTEKIEEIKTLLALLSVEGDNNMKRKTKHNLNEVQKREKEIWEQTMKKETDLLICLNKEMK